MSHTPFPLSESIIDDFRFAAKTLTGARRRMFQARITTQYFQGNTRAVETTFGWGRNNVALALQEAATGLTCLGAHSRSGQRPWELRFPDAAAKVRTLGESLGQQDATFKSNRIYTRLTAAAAILHLEAEALPKEQIPKPSAMNNILNRMGFKLRRILKCKPKKKFRRRTPSLKISKS